MVSGHTCRAQTEVSCALAYWLSGFLAYWLTGLLNPSVTSLLTYVTYQAKSVLCAMPSGQESECACCAGMPSLKEMQSKGSRSLELETTSGSKLRSPKHMAMLEGCSDYQSFWD